MLTVIHRRLPDRATLLGVGAGWHAHLDVLVARTTGKEPPPFWDGLVACGRNTTGGYRPDRTHEFQAPPMKNTRKGDKTMTKHTTGTREDWLSARLELLKAEKELTRRSDELARRRQELPWVRIDKEYRFETDDGSASLADLFRGRSQLLVYHFMFGPDYTAGARPARRSRTASMASPRTWPTMM